MAKPFLLGLSVVQGKTVVAALMGPAVFGSGLRFWARSSSGWGWPMDWLGVLRTDGRRKGRVSLGGDHPVPRADE
jgi:hypothetical protein